MKINKQPKVKTAADLVLEYKPIEVPYEVWTFIGTKQLEVVGNDISAGEDYKSLDDARVAIEWYVKQLNGIVLWDKVN